MNIFWVNVRFLVDFHTKKIHWIELLKTENSLSMGLKFLQNNLKPTQNHTNHSKQPKKRFSQGLNYFSWYASIRSNLLRIIKNILSLISMAKINIYWIIYKIQKTKHKDSRRTKLICIEINKKIKLFASFKINNSVPQKFNFPLYVCNGRILFICNRIYLQNQHESEKKKSYKLNVSSQQWEQIT